MKWDQLRRRLECPIDEDAGYVNDRWTNRDLIPIPPARRTYKVWSFVIYWFVSGACISAYTAGSTLLAIGLSAQQAIACVVVGAILTGVLSVVSGMPGGVHHVGFTVLARASWGMYGSFFPICLRAFNALWWFGIQAYWGGQAINAMLGAMSPSWKHRASTIPASSHITTQDLVGFILWIVAYVPLVTIPPERLQRPFIISSVAFACTLIGLLAWAVPHAGGAGPFFRERATASNPSFAMMLGITSILSTWGSGTLGQSDWIRYSKHRYYPLFSQLFLAPVMITACAVTGIVVTSASSQILGMVIWSPVELIGAIQDHYDSSSGVRAAVFFAGFGCAAAQLSLNVVLSAVSTGMDLAGLWPKYINIRRGAYLLGLLGILSNPWQVLSSAGIFLNVISGLGTFVAPMTGVMLADYHVVRRRYLKIEDMYVGDTSSIYWYQRGFHWRAFLAFFLGQFMFMPGFIMSLMGQVNHWTELFNICFLVGLFTAFLAYILICWVSPPQGMRDGLPYLDEDRFCNSVGRPVPPKGGGETPAEEDTGEKTLQAVQVYELNA